MKGGSSPQTRWAAAPIAMAGIRTMTVRPAEITELALRRLSTHTVGMAAAHASVGLDERQRFEGWVANLSDRRRARLAEHIEAARHGPAWMREWLTATDLSTATHLPPASALQDIHDALEDLERGDYIDLTPEQLDRWVESGEWPWPDGFPA